MASSTPGTCRNTHSTPQKHPAPNVAVWMDMVRITPSEFGTPWSAERSAPLRRCEPAGGVLRVVREHEVGAGAADRGEGLEHGLALVEPAVQRGGLQHRVLAAHVVGGHREGGR